MRRLALFSKIIFLAALGLHCCTWAFSSCSEQGLLSSCRVWASHCGGFSLLWSMGSRMHGVNLWLWAQWLQLKGSRFSSCGTWVDLVAPQHVASSRTRKCVLLSDPIFTCMLLVPSVLERKKTAQILSPL